MLLGVSVGTAEGAADDDGGPLPRRVGSWEDEGGCVLEAGLAVGVSVEMEVIPSSNEPPSALAFCIPSHSSPQARALASREAVNPPPSISAVMCSVTSANIAVV